MELMSMLLFCAFVARLPLALGVHSESDSDVRVKLNASISNVHSTVISDAEHRDLSTGVSHKANEITGLQPFLSDDLCKYCSTCVEKAVDVHKNYNHNFKIYHQTSELESSRNRIKAKRNVRLDFNNTEFLEDSRSKSVRVTKYKAADDKVYAIKVNEINSQTSAPNDGKSTCKVYSVKRAYPCESEESNLILMKRKVNKKKISKQKNTSATTEKSIAPVTSTEFKKRKLRVESAHVAESFMPSIEDLY